MALISKVIMSWVEKKGQSRMKMGVSDAMPLDSMPLDSKMSHHVYNV